MVAIKSGGDGTLSWAPSLLLSASPRAHHVAPCPIVSLWWSLICICAGTHLATGSFGAGVPLKARVPDGLSAASVHLLRGTTPSSFCQTYWRSRFHLLSHACNFRLFYSCANRCWARNLNVVLLTISPPLSDRAITCAAFCWCTRMPVFSSPPIVFLFKINYCC